MINFKKLIGPYGIPIYFQKLPEIVQSVALEWVIFTGAADDDNVGANGAYHWFEHVPFRGTKRFPGGYNAIQGPFTPFGGHLNAYTSSSSTGFEAYVQKKQWKKALDVITDLWSQPLMRDEDIEAERTIIFEEIRRKKSKAGSNAYYQLLNIVWPNHPLGHQGLGTEESLQSITPEQLRKAHKLGYDRSRATLFISGNLSEKEILDYAKKVFKVTPDNKLSERRVTASHKPVPTWQLGKETIVETNFSSSVIFMLFPIGAGKTLEEIIFLEFLGYMTSEGGLDSPLLRVVREEQKLAYSAEVSNFIHPDGGWFGFYVETKSDNVEKVKQALADVLKDSQLHSKQRFDDVKNAIYSDEKMRSISSYRFNSVGVDQLSDYGEVLGDKKYNALIRKIKLADVVKAFDAMTPDKAHTFIFRGVGKS